MIIALVVLAAPPILTNTYVAVDQVDADTVDAAKGIGLRPWQVMTRVELPLALPLIFAGIRTSTVFVIATATLGGFFGGGGLGDIISNQASYGLRGVIGASYVLIVLAFLSQALFLAHRAPRHPGRHAQSPAAASAAQAQTILTQGGSRAIDAATTTTNLRSTAKSSTHTRQGRNTNEPNCNIRPRTIAGLVLALVACSRPVAACSSSGAKKAASGGGSPAARPAAAATVR